MFSSIMLPIYTSVYTLAGQSRGFKCSEFLRGTPNLSSAPLASYILGGKKFLLLLRLVEDLLGILALISSMGCKMHPGSPARFCDQFLTAGWTTMMMTMTMVSLKPCTN